MSARKAKPNSSKSWQGRLTADADAATAAFVASLDVDRALWRYDVRGSIAHARMLSERKLISEQEFEQIRSGLEAIGRDIEAGRLDMPVELEDIHMVIERALIDRTGDAGAKLHTGRSRNDQVALDLRLWARDAADALRAGIAELQKALADLAGREGTLVWPAYTHLQRAQPILAGHAMLAYVEMLARDAGRLADARARADVCPLGSGAVAGSSLPLDRKRVAELLGFGAVSRNSVDATSDRDFLAELCFACAMLAVHLSRWAEDWILCASTEFGLIELDDAYCTSSSMMPQKKNPDTLELIRGKSAAAIASLTGMLALLKGLPLAYNRDLQDDKRFAFPTVDAMEQALAVAAGIVRTTRLRPEAAADATRGGYLDATSLAEYLTARGVPFRQAHHAVGRLVAQAEQEGRELAELPIETLREADERIGEDVYDCLGAANALARYATDGAGGERQLREQLAFWKRELA